ncbi:hypothetical protein Actkin_05193 [Actinokineospora sp. UTMC 2448]|nr:hypothetical protein Actkin_05193 [Actinokineospora sp. UTMC 2448]
MRTRLALLSVVAVAIGLGLLVLAQIPAVAGFRYLPVEDIGSSLFEIGLVTLALQWFFTEDMLLQIRSAVADGFAFDPEDLHRVASDEVMDRNAENTLGKRLGDVELAREAYQDLLAQTAHASELRYDTRVSITLTPWEGGPATGAGSMFVAGIRWEYTVRKPRTGLARFACVRDAGAFRSALGDPTYTDVWMINTDTGLDARDQAVFSLEDYSVNGQRMPIKRSVESFGQVFTVDASTTGTGTGRSDGEPTRIAYTYRTLVPQHSHILFLNARTPTRGLRMQVSHHRAGIATAAIVDFLATANHPLIYYSPATLPTQTATLDFDKWVWPKAGLALVWTLDREYTTPNPTR